MAVRMILKPILPKISSNLVQVVRRQLTENGMREFLREEIVTRADQTVEGWDHHVDFVSRVTVSPNYISGWVYPQGPGADIWKWVSRGVAPHLVRAHRSGTGGRGGRVNRIPRLYFQTGPYDARTSPGSLVSRGGNAEYGKLINPTYAMSEIEPRYFEETIAQEVEHVYGYSLQKTLNDAFRECGLTK